MNEEEKELDVRIRDYEDGYNHGFQKGKLEQKKEELELLIKIKNNLYENNSDFDFYITLDQVIEQLQKEIGGMK